MQNLQMLWIPIVLAGLAQTMSLAAPTQQRVALVIGNNRYSWRPLKNAVNDAQAVAKSLRDLDFKVIEKHDATKSDIESGAAEFVGALRPGDIALFYYAGHAVQVEGQNLLIPVDIDRVANSIDLSFRSYSINHLLDYLRRHDGGVRIIILDACRNNPFSEERGLAAGLATPALGGPNTYFIFSTSPNTVASDNPEGQNSYFTEAFVELIMRPNVSLDDMMNDVGSRVRVLTRGQQTPWKNGNLTKRFYFIPPANEGPIGDVSAAVLRYREGLSQLWRGNWVEAADLFRQVVGSSAKPALLERARAAAAYAAKRQAAEQSSQNDPITAAALFAEAFKLCPPDADSAIQSAAAYLVAGKIEPAVEMLSEAHNWGDSTVSERAFVMLTRLAAVSKTARKAAATRRPGPPPFDLLPRGAWFHPFTEYEESMDELMEKLNQTLVVTLPPDELFSTPNVSHSTDSVFVLILSGRDFAFVPSDSKSRPRKGSLRLEGFPSGIPIRGSEIDRSALTPTTVDLPAGTYEITVLLKGERLISRVNIAEDTTITVTPESIRHR